MKWNAKILKLLFFQFATSIDERGTSATSWATAPAPPSLLMLKTCFNVSMKIKQVMDQEKLKNKQS